MKNSMITIVAHKFIQDTSKLTDIMKGNMEYLLEKLIKGVYNNSITIEGIEFSLVFSKIESGKEWQETPEY